MDKISINSNLCEKDGACVDACPLFLFTQKTKESIPLIFNQDLCISCGHCVAICPHSAVIHKDFYSVQIPSVNNELLPSSDSLLELIRSRRSIREFKDVQVEKEKIEQIIDAARFAPTASNTQSVEYIVVQDKKILGQIIELTTQFLEDLVKQLKNPMRRSLLKIVAKEEINGLLKGLDEFEFTIENIRTGKDQILHDANTLIFFHSKKGTIFGEANANLALHNATLMAETLGLGSFYLGYVTAVCSRERTIPSLIRLPFDHVINAAMGLGYPKREYKNWIEKKPAQIIWL